MNQVLKQLQPEFNKECEKLGISVSDKQSEQLLNYLSSLLKWNKAFNLTAIRDPKEALYLHLLDSVVVSPAIKQFDSCLDVGTGGGLPGIPLAILNPNKEFTLLDTNSKKTRFLKQVVYELGLKNVTVVNKRVQDFQSDSGYACILSRAFASLKDMTDWTWHLLAKGGQWLAMKGVYPQQEIEELAETLELVESKQVKVPNLDATRYFIYLQKIS
ncbi:16S rRNA (guanine(527)-N(7))-methyltransferase RsmG [Kangiella sediminilitoris]|uniref:Ribosomal RNA small subunit methyltransferase G n=1 Tax=Kangiella sediminilitoris TaxID=1144748 RepID=A0A1B3BDZ7_9GAMM|nr:16S rRNA (guanine(527)-N(7))-methyltransferase RsmG [Kangiella sediminilitoris]AOE51032.1 Ribosomal RNA small subunit methyltransferase G [Kangiella sediminilitoris]